MDNQLPNQPVSPTPFTTTPVTTAPLPGAAKTPGLPKPPRNSSGGPGSMTMILLGLLGFGALIFGVLTIVFYNQAQTATKTLEAQKSTATAKAKAEQKKIDDEANTVANESPFRSYVSPVEYGSFEVKFPKNWSAHIDQEKTGTQITLVLNPDFIRRTNNSDELSAARVYLIERTSDQYMSQYATLIKRGVLKQNDITVSGQKGFDITGGGFQDKRTTRMVVIPVRDKVLVFVNENSRYAGEFNEVLAQSHVIP